MRDDVNSAPSARHSEHSERQQLPAGSEQRWAGAARQKAPPGPSVLGGEDPAKVSSAFWKVGIPHFPSSDLLSLRRAGFTALETRLFGDGCHFLLETGDRLTLNFRFFCRKLKNRVAAQTSRDRKKAKLEQMETAIQQLFNKNETLIGECERLRAANERLLAENSELQRRLQVRHPDQ